MKHTPTPKGLIVTNADGSKDIFSWPYLVKAVNTHEELLSLLKTLSQEIKEGGIDKTSAYSLLIDRTIAKAEGK